MKNDTTWEYSDNSEINKQQATRSLGNLAGSRSKTPVPRSPLPIREAKLHHPSSIIHNPSRGVKQLLIAHC
jgi:hypothetical protein